MKNIIKQTISLLLLAVFLLSTSGMVMYYHFCQYSDDMVVSVFIDSTSDSCTKSAHTKLHEDEHTCANCCNIAHTDKCCDDHKSTSKTAKLNIPLTFSNDEIAIEPCALELPFEYVSLNSHLEQINLNIPYKYKLREFKPVSVYGRTLVTFLNSFKVYC